MPNKLAKFAAGKFFKGFITGGGASSIIIGVLQQNPCQVANLRDFSVSIGLGILSVRPGKPGAPQMPPLGRSAPGQ